MLGYDSSEDQRPITYLNGYPIYATTLLIIVHVVAFLLSAMMVGAGNVGVLNALAFSSSAVWSGAVWQPLTYLFVQNPGDGIWFAVEMVMLFMFGRQVEQYLGRNSFLRLYAFLALLAPVLLTIAGLFFPSMLAGSRGVHFAIFVTFAAIYPGAPMLFSITAKWAAIILIAIYSVQAMAFHDIPQLLTLWASAGAAVAYIAHNRGSLELPDLRFWKRQPRFTVVREEPPLRSRKREPVEEDEIESIDPLLDKIARSGMASLTAKERQRLEQAREALMKKGSSSR